MLTVKLSMSGEVARPEFERLPSGEIDFIMAERCLLDIWKSRPRAPSGLMLLTFGQRPPPVSIDDALSTLPLQLPVVASTLQIWPVPAAAKPHEPDSTAAKDMKHVLDQVRKSAADAYPTCGPEELDSIWCEDDPDEKDLVELEASMAAMLLKAKKPVKQQRGKKHAFACKFIKRAVCKGKRKVTVEPKPPTPEPSKEDVPVVVEPPPKKSNHGCAAPKKSNVVYLPDMDRDKTVKFTELYASKDGTKICTGYSLECRHHGPECVRDLTWGAKDPMSRDEARKRLLRWEQTAVLGDGKRLSVGDHQSLAKSKLLVKYATGAASCADFVGS